ncbi:hypothetical protein Fmac_007225 [Flemingia macrophylla]|uniref:Uncharacterized protein n=1 Tax=Flemingia macrophylla TaxID=520843 RepID=A0ABD1NCV1_9FABA
MMKYLDENKNLMKAILANITLGNLAKCAKMQQHLQAIAMGQQHGISPPYTSLQFGNPQQQLHQQTIQGQITRSPTWIGNDDPHPMHREVDLGGGSNSGSPSIVGLKDACGESMQGGASESG